MLAGPQPNSSPIKMLTLAAQQTLTGPSPAPAARAADDATTTGLLRALLAPTSDAGELAARAFHGVLAARGADTVKDIWRIAAWPVLPVFERFQPVSTELLHGSAPRTHQQGQLPCIWRLAIPVDLAGMPLPLQL